MDIWEGLWYFLFLEIKFLLEILVKFPMVNEELKLPPSLFFLFFGQLYGITQYCRKSSKFLPSFLRMQINFANK